MGVAPKVVGLHAGAMRSRQDTPCDAIDSLREPEV